MSDLIINNVSLIILMPLWIFLVVMGGRFFSVYVNKIIIYTLTLLASLWGTLICGLILKNFHDVAEWSVPFLKINNFALMAGIHIDRISLIFGMLLFGISFCVQLFSISYMKEEKKNYRFFALLNLFNFGMSALIFSPNLYQLYVFWEIVGVVSYLLIGFDYSNQVKSEASRRVFLINRFGDTALITGMILVTYFMYNYAGNYNFASLSIFDLNSISTFLMGYTSTFVFLSVCCLFIIGAMVKSAQFPFHVWLLDAMEAKAPVSALLHSATMVAAGIYLIIRLLPFFTLNPYLMEIVLIAGLLTAMICSICASLESNPKKVLAYSTSANLGLMFFLLGLGNVKAALIFLIFHALVKSAMFLSLPDENGEISRIKYSIFIISALTLSGLIFAGFFPKESLYLMVSGTVLKVIISVIYFITAFYAARVAILIYKNDFEKQKALETTALFLLMAGNVGFCFLLPFVKISYSYIAAVLGLIFALIFNKLNIIEKFNKMPKLTEKVMYDCVSIIYNKISNYAYSIDKNIFSNYKPLLSLAKINVRVAGWIEKNIMNKSVSLITNFACEFSRQDSKLQSGNVQTYNAYALIFVTIILTLVIIGYTFVITAFGGD